MEDSITLLWLLGISTAIYLLVRLGQLSSNVDTLKQQVAHLLAARPEGIPPLQSPAPDWNARQGVQPLRPDGDSRTGQASSAPEFLLDPMAPGAAPYAAPQSPSRPIPAPPVLNPAAARSARPEGFTTPAPRPPRPLPVEPRPPFDIESVIGANWMAKLGVAAIAVSVAFFLQYAFRSGWIKPWGQVGIGLCGAVLMMGAGQVLLANERFRSYAQVLFSGGIVVYFLSIYAAYSFYQPALIGYWPAFGALAVGALAASALALANKTEVVAVICILGAFAAPALIRDHTGPPSPDGLTRLYVYLVAINVWALAFIRFRAWYSVAIVSFTCTWLLFIAAGPLANGGWKTEGFAMLFLLSAIWTGVQAIYSESGESSESAAAGGASMRATGTAVIAAASLVFVFTSASILSGSANFGIPDVAVAGTLTGLLLAGLALGLPPTARGDAEMRQGFSILSAVASGGVMAYTLLNARAVPAPQVPAAFAFTLLNFALFFVMGLAIRRHERGGEPAALLLGVNAGVHLLMVLHVLAQTKFAGVPAACLWLPLAALLTMGGVWFATSKESLPPAAPAVLAISAQVFIITALFRALGVNSLTAASHWPTTAAWVLAVEFALLSATWVALRDRIAWPNIRMDIVGAFGNAIVFFAMMAWALGTEKTQGLSVLAACAVLAAGWHGLIGGVVLSEEGEDGQRRYAYLGLAVTFLTIAVPLQLELAWITVAWAVEGAMVVWAGVAANSAAGRRLGYTVLSIAALRAIFVDLAHAPRTFHFLFNERMLAGFAVVAAAYLSAWLVRNRRESPSSQEASAPALLTVLANLLTVAFISKDLWQRFGMGSSPAAESIQHLALTLFWALYAGIAVWSGCLRGRLEIRVFGAFLLILAALKAIALDLSIEPARFLLMMNPRIWAGMAVIACAYVSAWLLWRRREDIHESEKALPAGFLVLANAYTLVFLSRDLWQFYGAEASGVVSAQQLALSIFWALYGLAAISVGIWSRQKTVRLFAMALLYVSIFKVFLYDLRQLETPYRIASFFTLGVVFLLVSYLYTRFEERMREQGGGAGPPSPGAPQSPRSAQPGAAT